MVTVPVTRLAAATCGLALSLTVGAGVASAEPDVTPVVNSPCTYKQVVAALNAQYPDAAEQFRESPESQAWLHDLVAAPRPQRRQILLDMANRPEAAPFQDIVVPLATSCRNY